MAGVALGDIDEHSAYADARCGGKIQQPNNVLDSTKAKNHKENAANVCQHLGIPRFLMNHGQHRVQFCLILHCCWTPIPEGKISALWLCPKYCEWNCSIVRLWLCMSLNWMQLNAPWFWGGLFLVLIYVQELTCQHFVHPGIPCESSHAPDYVSVQPLQPCHELRGLTWRRIRNTRSRHVQVSGRKLIPRKGNSKSARHYVLPIKNALFL